MSPTEKQSRPLTFLNLLVFLSLLALFLSLAVHQIVNFDIWWHLKTGRYILENLAVPRSDIYTFTYSGSRWIDLHWLFQVAVYSLYSLFGPGGLIIFQALILGSAFLFISNASPERPPLALSGLFIMCALFVCEERFLVRPEIFTLLFAAVYIYSLERRSRRLIPLIPLFQIIWVNTSGLFIIGPAILYLHLIGETARVFFCRGRREGGMENLKIVAAVALISTVVCIINPFGTDGLVFPLKLFSRIGGACNIHSVTIGEFQPPLKMGPAAGPFSRAAVAARCFLSGHVTNSVFFFKILIVISMLSIVFNIRKLKISSLLIYSAFLYLALSARRNMALFSFAAIPFSIENIASFWHNLRGGRKLKTAVHGAAAAIILLTVSWEVPAIISGRYYMRDNLTKRFGLGLSPMMCPLKAAGFVKDASVGGHLFNDLASGGLLIWNLYPRRKIFIDGRLEVMPDDFYRMYLDIIKRPEDNFADTAARYDIQMVILNHRAVGARLPNYLYDSPLWEPVYFDEVGVVFCLNSAKNALFIKEHMVDFSVPLEDGAVQGDFPYGHFYRGNFLMAIGLHGPAFEEYRKGLRLYPAYGPGYNALGRIYEERGEIDEARRLYQRALEIDRDLFDAHLNLGNLELQNGAPGKSLGHYRSALSINPTSLDASVNMGTALARVNDIPGAIRQYKKAILIDPASEAAARNLRIVTGKAQHSQ